MKQGKRGRVEGLVPVGTRQPMWLWGDAVFLRGICRDLAEVHFERAAGRDWQT